MAELPEPLSGVAFRRWAGEEDIPGMAAVLNAAVRHDGVGRHMTVESMANVYRHLTNCDLPTDLVIAERDGAIVGYRRAFWYVEEDTGDRVLAHGGWVRPDARDHDLGKALMLWSEARLLDIAAAAPHDGSDQLMSWADEVEEEAIRDLERLGYSVKEIYAEMTRSLHDPIPEHPLPRGVEIRPVSDADRRRVWEADREAFRDHVGFSPGTEEDYQEFATRPVMDPALWKVGFDGNEIAGQVLNYVDREENEALGRRWGWTEWISTQRAWRGRGLAKALITESMRMFRDMGMDEVALEVHTTNPTGAFRLYETLGYEVVATSYEYRKEVPT